jgi:hypothetical protein
MPRHEPIATRDGTAAWAIAALLVILAVGLLFTGAPNGGASYWSDSPRHALNGVFVMDLLRDLPLGDPAGYAYRYDAQYPALTILFYPPLFYALSAPFYALLGVSRELALLVVALQLAQLINDGGVHYVVKQPGFWTDLEAMRRFERVVNSPQFEKMVRIPTPANFRAHESELVIYRNLGPVGPKPDKLNIELKIINRHITVH